MAFGKTGPARDTFGYVYPSLIWQTSEYAADWTDTSVTGVNLKYSDGTGDGILDTNDIVYYTHVVWDPNPIYTSARSVLQKMLSVPSLYIIPDRDTIGPGDSLNFYIIVGDQSMPVDSLCGLAFSGVIINADLVYDHVFSNDMGTLGVNLYSFSRHSINGSSTHFFLSCRTDGQ